MIIPTKKLTASTPCGHTSNAMRPRKAMRAKVEISMQVAGMDEHRAKKK
jgi:hypothetical protein